MFQHVPYILILIVTLILKLSLKTEKALKKKVML